MAGSETRRRQLIAAATLALAVFAALFALVPARVPLAPPPAPAATQPSGSSAPVTEPVPEPEGGADLGSRTRTRTRTTEGAAAAEPARREAPRIDASAVAPAAIAPPAAAPPAIAPAPARSAPPPRTALVAQAPDLPPGPCALVVEALEAVSALPLAGAEITARCDEGLRSEAAGADGIAQFEGLAEGLYRIEARAPAHVTATGTVRVRGAQRARSTLSVDPLAIADVRVVDGRGEPLPEAEVVILYEHASAGEKSHQGAVEVPAGRLIKFRGFDKGFFEGRTTLAEVARTFAPGERASVELRLLPRSPARVLVRVADRAGKPIEGATVWCGDHVTTGPDGSALIPAIAPGRRGCSVSADGFRPVYLQFEAREGEQVELLATLDRAPEGVEGRVVDRSARPLAGAIVVASSMAGAELARATTGAEGRFRIEGLGREDRTVKIGVAGPAGFQALYWPARGTWNSPPRGTAELVLLAGARPAVRLRLLAPEGAPLHDHADIEADDERFRALGDPARRAEVDARIAADGTVAIEMPDLGDYRHVLLRTDGFAAVVLPDMDFSSGAPDPPEREVRLVPAAEAGRLAVGVRDPVGRPAAGARVRVRPAGWAGAREDSFLAEAFADAEGRTSFGGLPGRVEVGAAAPGAAAPSRWTALAVPLGPEPLEVEVSLE